MYIIGCIVSTDKILCQKTDLWYKAFLTLIEISIPTGVVIPTWGHYVQSDSIWPKLNVIENAATSFTFNMLRKNPLHFWNAYTITIFQYTLHNDTSNFQKHEMRGDSKYPKWLYLIPVLLIIVLFYLMCFNSQ